MIFIVCLLVGILFPFLFIKAKSSTKKWIPAMILFFMTIIMGVKAKFFPGAEMAVLGEIVYIMILGTATIGSTLGAIIIQIWKKK